MTIFSHPASSPGRSVGRQLFSMGTRAGLIAARKPPAAGPRTVIRLSKAASDANLSLLTGAWGRPLTTNWFPS
jgi:hypothetical protein